MSSPRRWLDAFRRLALALAASSPLIGFAAEECAEQPTAAAAAEERHFMVLAGSSDVFYDRSGPAFVMLLRLDPAARESEVGAVGIYADDERRPLFGPVPAERYNEFLRESEDLADVMLRVEITGPQYRRVLAVLRAWDRRARENALLYPDVSMDNILLVKQATEELNRCAPTLALHALDWGLADDISENNPPLAIPLEYFKRLRQLNESAHVPDNEMPEALLVADQNPLPPRPVPFEPERAPARRTDAAPHVHPAASEQAAHSAVEHVHEGAR
jgi:hypothetical protein